MTETSTIAAAQGGVVVLAGVIGGIPLEFLQVLLGGVAGAFSARVFAPITIPPLTFVKSFALFVCSSIIAAMLGGFLIELGVKHDYLSHTLNTRLFVGTMIGFCGQGIAEFVQSLPALAKANLVDAVKAFFARAPGKGAQ